MFMVTLGKNNLRRAALLVVGVVFVGGILFVRKGGLAPFGDNSATGEIKIETAQDVETYFTGYGIAIDPASLHADRVQVPKTWDDNFVAFHDIVGQSGYDLKDAKGETVEKWVAQVPAQSDGKTTQYAVLLLQEGDIMGAYLLNKPSGEVLGLEDAVGAMAELRANSGADSGSALEGAGGSSASTEGAAETSADAPAEPMPESRASLEVDLVPDADGFPVE